MAWLAGAVGFVLGAAIGGFIVWAIFDRAMKGLADSIRDAVEQLAE